MIHNSLALSGRINFFGANTQGIVLMHEALGFALTAFQAAGWVVNEQLDGAPHSRLEKPPEPSPGLSGAMPWVNVPKNIPRPEGAREA